MQCAYCERTRKSVRKIQLAVQPYDPSTQWHPADRKCPNAEQHAEDKRDKVYSNAKCNKSGDDVVTVH